MVLQQHNKSYCEVQEIMLFHKRSCSEKKQFGIIVTHNDIVIIIDNCHSHYHHHHRPYHHHRSSSSPSMIIIIPHHHHHNHHHHRSLSSPSSVVTIRYNSTTYPPQFESFFWLKLTLSFAVDVDECTAASPSICHANASCTNTLGSYNCSCKLGYIGDRKTCRGNN